MTEVVVSSTRYPYDDTVARLRKAITDTGNNLFADLDQSVAAQSVGLTLRPTRLLVFGNPRGGTPLMDAFPLIALDLPLKLLVWEENAKVKVAYTQAAVLAERYDVTGKDAQIAAMDRTLEAVVAAVA
jgi:uncharacterized protein (DUF302 family)